MAEHADAVAYSSPSILKLLLNTVGSDILTLFALYMPTCGKSPFCSCAGNRSQMTVPVETPDLASPYSIEMSH
jgi:hypothetical protein